MVWITPTSLIVDNKVNSDPIVIANKFNHYFSSIASNLQGQIYHKEQDFTHYLKNRNSTNFFVNPTDKYEIIDTINSLSKNKALGPHSTPTDVLHLIKLIITDALSEIINLSFVNGIYIDNLKISKTIPTFKEKGNRLDYNNYRPISLLSNINKIIEKLMYSRLINSSLPKTVYMNCNLGFVQTIQLTMH